MSDLPSPEVVAAARERAARGEKSFVAIAAQADHIDALTARLEAAEKVVEAAKQTHLCKKACPRCLRLVRTLGAYDAVVEGS